MNGPLDYAQMIGALYAGLLGNVAMNPYKRGISPSPMLEGGAAPYRGGGQMSLPLSGGRGTWENMPTLYHGSNRSFETLKPNRGRVYLTSDPAIASQYSTYRATKRDPGAPQVTPVKARFENPLIIDMKGKSALHADDMAGGNVNAIAKAGKHDAIIYKNMMDIYSGKPQDQYIAIKPGTLKSKITGATMYGGILGLGDILSGALERKEPLPPM